MTTTANQEILPDRSQHEHRQQKHRSGRGYLGKQPAVADPQYLNGVPANKNSSPSFQADLGGH